MSAYIFIPCLSSMFPYSIKIPSFLHCLSVPYFHPICIHISALGMKTKLYAVPRFPTVQLPLPSLAPLCLSVIHILCSVYMHPFSIQLQTLKRFPLPLSVDVATDFISCIKPLYLWCILITIILLQRATEMWSVWQGMQDTICPKHCVSFMAIKYLSSWCCIVRDHDKV